LIATEQIPIDESVELCRRGDQSGYKRLYTQYSKAMYNTSLRIVNNESDAEDILQEAFLDAFRSINNFAYRSTFGAWLKRIVINKSINLLKSKRLSTISFDEQTEPIDKADHRHEEEFEYRIEQVKDSIRQLPDGYRTVLTLHLVEGYNQEEVAVIMGISHSTVRTQYMRAKQRLICLLKTARHER
jgi:RNA polymerase sigma factor (sigma-70 family)